MVSIRETVYACHELNKYIFSFLSLHDVCLCSRTYWTTYIHSKYHQSQYFRLLYPLQKERSECKKQIHSVRLQYSRLKKWYPPNYFSTFRDVDLYKEECEKYHVEKKEYQKTLSFLNHKLLKLQARLHHYQKNRRNQVLHA